MAEIKWTQMSKGTPREFGIEPYTTSARALVTFEDPDVFYGLKSRTKDSRIVAPVHFANGFVASVTPAPLGVPIAWAYMPEPYTEDLDGGRLTDGTDDG